MYYYYYYYYGNENLKLHMKYDYLKVTDIAKIMTGTEYLCKDILKLIGQNEITDNETGDKFVFSLVIDEAKTVSSIDLSFGQTWTVKKLKKNLEKRVTKKFEINVSIGLKEVVAFLMITSAINYHNKIGEIPNLDIEKIENINKKIIDNQLWKQINNKDLKVLNKKSDILIKSIIDNPSINEVIIDGTRIK